MRHTSSFSSGKRVLALSLTAALAAAAFTGMSAAPAVFAAETEYGLTDSIQSGTILHCFDWKYADIEAELENIAKAGFTTVQTSPAQASEGKGAWYWLYQPLGFSVGTNELGTKEELASLCKAAEKYGINVVVDVVANHLADNHTNIQADLVGAEYWHTMGEVKDYNVREQVTQGDIGMTDLNTENAHVQEVVKQYAEELKSLGVSGIRWDAAKHIALPSEGSDFWSTVTIDGLYHYGEILIGPMDKGGDDLMKEYTDYMSVTDSSYCSAVLSAFNSGKAPESDGNWNGRGISSDKLVYWAESHDTYSNGEGKGSNAVSQNVVDRAYAVVAARSDASSLYLSRPFATARDSIRIGVKGSMHFTSPEIAAVNHFHNAMNGKSEAYTVSENCSVVARKDGGAVIVCGSGSGEVSVTNPEGFVPAGTYKDEVTGSEFTVTASTISGTVGESGIAVVYDSDFVSKVYATAVTEDVFNSETLKVTLHAVDVKSAQYTTSEGASGSFTDGTSIRIGKDSEPDTVITVTLTGEGNNGKALTETYRFTKKAKIVYPTLENGGVVFNNELAKWKKVNVYVYDESTGTVYNNGDWPGAAMTLDETGFYTYELPDSLKDCHHIMVIFNNGVDDQIPGAMQDGLEMNFADKMFYDGTKWMALPENVDTPEEPDDDTSKPDQESQTSDKPSEPTGDPTPDTPYTPGETTGGDDTPSEADTPYIPADTSDHSGTVAVAAGGMMLLAGVLMVLAGKKREN